MPSFINKIGKLFKKQETYKPSNSTKSGAKKAAPKKPKTQAEAKSTPSHRKKPQGGQRPQRKPQASKKPSKPWNPESFNVKPEEGKTRFHDIDLPDEIMHAIDDLKFKYCTPIQAEILPLTLDGKDMAGKAQTGTGKTAAFLLGIFTQFFRKGKGRSSTNPSTSSSPPPAA